MALYASGVAIPKDLSTAIGGTGSPGYNAYNTINSNYANAKGQLNRDALARGLPGGAGGPNSYGGNQLSTGQDLATGNLESALGQGLGNTAYENTLQERQFGQNEDLARKVAALNKPDLLQQILGGIGEVGGTAAGIYGAMGRRRPGGGGTPMPSGGGSSWNPMQPGPLDLGYGGF